MARSSGSTFRIKQQRSGSVLYSGPGSVSGVSSTRLRPYRLAKRRLNSYVSRKWNRVSRKITGTERSIRLSRCARTMPPPPKLTVRATLRGKVSTAQARVAAGSAPDSAAARSRTSSSLSIGCGPQVTQLHQAVDHPSRARGHVFTLGVDHQLRRERLLVRIRHARELGDLPRQGPGVQALGVAANALVE